MLLLIIPIKCLAPSTVNLTVVVRSPIERYLPLYRAVAFVETHENALSVNLEEWAFGIIQIRQCMLDDFNRATGFNYSLFDCYREEVSKKIFYWHCCRYVDFELCARRWNGSGKMTDNYWVKVKNKL